MKSRSSMNNWTDPRRYQIKQMRTKNQKQHLCTHLPTFHLSPSTHLHPHPPHIPKELNNYLHGAKETKKINYLQTPSKNILGSHLTMKNSALTSNSLPAH